MILLSCFTKRAGEKGKILVALSLLCFFLLIAATESLYASQDHWILINLPAQRLYLYHHNEMVKDFPIAIGHKETPTPTGSFTITTKVLDPIWWPPDGGDPVYPGPSNPLGRYWLGFYGLTYGIHGNNNPRSIGHSISRGCIRMFNEDIEYLFTKVGIGAHVEITYQQVHLVRKSSPYIAIYQDVYGLGLDLYSAIKDQLEAEDLTQEIYPRAMKEIVFHEGFNALPIKVEIWLNDEKRIGFREGDSIWMPVDGLEGLWGEEPLRHLGGKKYWLLPSMSKEQTHFFREKEVSLRVIPM